VREAGVSWSAPEGEEGTVKRRQAAASSRLRTMRIAACRIGVRWPTEKMVAGWEYSEGGTRCGTNKS
jgi:hypothetical protein